jgi:ABC-type Fe3+ transport system permease subunit
MRNYYNNDGDNDVVPVILPTEGPIIVPLMRDQLRPQRGAMFDILLSDLSSDCKAKYDWHIGKRNSNQQIPKRSKYYRRSREEYLCFIFVYAVFAILSFVVLFGVVFEAIESYKWQHDEHNDYGYAHDGENMTDDYKAENFKEQFKNFFYGDVGFD